MEINAPLSERLRNSYNRFIALSLLTAVLLLLVRVYEIVVISRITPYPQGSLIVLIFGLQFDLLLYLRFLIVLFVPYLIIAVRRPALAKIVYVTLVLMVVIAEVFLLQYFSTAKVPLGADLFGYSLAEIKQTIGASGQINILTILPLIIFYLLVVLAFDKYPHFKVPTTFVVVLSVLMFFVALGVGKANPDPIDYRSDFNMYIGSNKFNFFSDSVWKYWWGTDEYDDLQSSSGEDNSTIPSSETYNLVSPIHMNQEKEYTDEQIDSIKNNLVSETLITESGNTGEIISLSDKSVTFPFEYISQQYPFLHKENTADLLSAYFKTFEKAPSFVFIIVESLGRAYSGDGAYLGSYTPFLDSLSQQGLYWENCLSTSGRTFGVMPSILASLPFGDKGFADMGEQMPDHHSIINILKSRLGYSSRFYYGGDPAFDNMQLFMKREGVDKIVGINDFGNSYTKLPANNAGYSWGYGDKDLFRKYLLELKRDNVEKRIDIMLTLAMHNPFSVPGQESYIQRFEKRMSDLSLKEEMRTYNRQYKDQFATIIYFDDALRSFFNEFSQYESFANTIFIITGDHRMPEIPISTQLDRFHVPLLIYSPLLQKSERFKAVSSHFDVTPSLLALMKGKMNLQLPSLSAWIGHGLDTSTSFRNLNEYPLMRNTTELIDYISGTNMISGQTLYNVFGDLDIEPIRDEVRQDELRAGFSEFKAKNRYACQNNKIIPDSMKIK